MIDIHLLKKNSLPLSNFLQLEEIFFQSSGKKSFSSQKERSHFFKTWTDYYLNPSYPGKTLTAKLGNQILGYLTYCYDSHLASDYYKKNVPSYQLFSDLFENFPAHLHINLHYQSRGQGIGSLLIKKCISDLKSKNISGLHIVTSPSSKNVNFYKKNGFDFIKEREFNNISLLFMGIKTAPRNCWQPILSS